MDTKIVFQLRKKAKDLEGREKLELLTKGLKIAEELYHHDSSDEWIQKALAYTLIDMCKYFIEIGDNNSASKKFEQLARIKFNIKDDIIENQKHFISKRTEYYYDDVKKAEEYSKNGNHEEAINIIKTIKANNRFSNLHHETYGWIIYRYIKDKNSSLTSIEVRKLLKEYIELKNIRPSMLHSCILELSLNYSRDHSDFNFYNFFKLWGPDKLLDVDWREGKKDDNVYKPLAYRCLKKVFDIISEQKINDVKWLLPVYSKAIKIFSDDEWILREYGLLLIKEGDYKLAISIYQKLVLSLGDKFYIWKEFASCFVAERELKIGMLSKAIQVEKNEDFLGSIHLELAKLFFESNLIENCIVELHIYMQHISKTGWIISESYYDLSSKVNGQYTNLRDNQDLYNDYVLKAENFAYNDINWSEFVLIDKWVNNEGIEKLTFANSKSDSFAIDSKKNKIFEKSQFGDVFRVKLYKKDNEIGNKSNLQSKENKSLKANKYIPLLFEKSEKLRWSILEDIYAVVEYINIEKNIVHLLTSDNKEVFLRGDNSALQLNEIVKSQYYIKTLKNETKIILINIKKIDKKQEMINFPSAIVIIDSINYEKNLFHFLGSKKIQGVIKFDETDIKPKEGMFLEIFYIEKMLKKSNKNIIKVLQICETDKKNMEFLKRVDGYLTLKYKDNYRTIDYDDLDDESKKNNPDFGFLNNCYVSKDLLINNNITTNCDAIGIAALVENKWKIILIKKL